VEIKLIAMDIDGTLLDSTGQMPEENKHAIAEAAARGVEIVIVTGRRFHSAQRIGAELGCDLHLIVSNGAVIKSPSGETHYRRLLPVDAARGVLDATAEFRPCAGVIFDRPHRGQVFFERIDWEGPFIGPYLRKYKELVEEIQPLTACLDGEDPVEVMFVGECKTLRRALHILEAHPAAGDYTLALTEYEQRGMSMLDVLQRGVSKGAALAEWTRRRGIAREEVMAIGDNWNDREMLEFAGLPVVMANAVPELKSRGWSVTLSNDECGVAEAIRQYALADDWTRRGGRHNAGQNNQKGETR
jgi:Cof subfamily protein (haloacid dehalogenase superfamily)